MEQAHENLSNTENVLWGNSSNLELVLSGILVYRGNLRGTAGDTRLQPALVSIQSQRTS